MTKLPDVVESVFQSSTDKTRQTNAKRLARRLADPLFKEHVKTVKNAICSGRSMTEARDSLPKVSNQYFEDIRSAISRYSITPENILLEWQIRNQSRYQQAQELYIMARKKGSMEMMSRAVMMLQKIDEADIELKREFGLIRPIVLKDVEQNSEASGISDKDVNDARERFELELRQRILNKLEIERDAHAPVTIDVLTRIDFTRDADQVEPSAVAEDPASGRSADNGVSQSQSDGRVDVLHPMGALVVQAKKDT